MVTRDVPTPQKGEMLIKVAAAAINRPDVVQVRSKSTLHSSVKECILPRREQVTFRVWSVRAQS